MGKTERQRFKEKRTRLYAENPYCPFCGVHMILPEDVDRNEKGNLITLPPNLCTIEHLYSRFNPLRHTKNHNNEQRNIICCRKCNLERAIKEEGLLGINELHRRSRLTSKRRKRYASTTRYRTHQNGNSGESNTRTNI